MLYPALRKLLFVFPPEAVHHLAMGWLKTACSIPGAQSLIKRSFEYEHSIPATDVFGLHFKNPVGLAAGFDKNACYLRELDSLGFGSVEIGTVTPLPQQGNEKPRLFRLPKDKALINRMGFNNDGVYQVRKRLEQWKISRHEYAGLPAHSVAPRDAGELVIGGNIGRNKVTSNEDAWKDYETCFRELFDCVDYFVVNVSSPNTPGLRELQEKDSLKKIFSHLQTINHSKTKLKPILLKIAPDLTTAQLSDIIQLAMEINLDGIVATNTSVSRAELATPQKVLDKIGPGGLSGKPLQKRSTEVVRYLFKNSNGKIPIIASGGIFSGADAREKLDAGASLIQVWTGFIYEGPSIAKKINKELIESISQN